MIKATIQNSPYCSEITFPCTEAELLKKLEELGMSGDELAPVGTIVQIEPTELSMLENQEVSLDALNYLGKRLDGMDDLERNQFLAALSCDELDIEWDLKKVINLTYSLPRYTLIEDTDDLERIGRTHILNIRGAVAASELENRDWLAEEGRKLLDSGRGINTEYGKLFVNEEIEFREYFNGITLPVYYCDPNAIVSVEIEYGENIELVELPNEDIAIKKALFRLGADSLNECGVEISTDYDITSNWWSKITELEKSKDLFAMNALLKSEDVLMKNESIFKKEIAQRLNNEEYNFSIKNGEIAVTLSDGNVVKIRNKDALYSDGAFSEKGRDEYLALSRLTREIYEYCSAYEKAAPLIADSLSKKYRLLTEFAGTVLAARYDEYMGFEYVTWLRSADGKSVCNGNYYSDYESAKENFAVRSCLINSNKLFDNAELVRLNRCVDFTLNQNNDLSFDECEYLKRLNERISESVPEPQQSNDPKMSM